MGRNWSNRVRKQKLMWAPHHMMKSPPLFLLRIGKAYLSWQEDLEYEGRIGIRRWGEWEGEYRLC